MGIFDLGIGHGKHHHSSPAMNGALDAGQGLTPRPHTSLQDSSDAETGSTLLQESTQSRSESKISFAPAVATPSSAPDTSSTFRRVCRADRLELYFSSNLADTSKGCHRDDPLGCGLWYAAIDLPAKGFPTLTACAPKVRELQQIFAPNDGWARWFPTVAQDEHGVRTIAYNKTDAAGSLHDRNRVVVTTLTGPHTIPDPNRVRSIRGARFPDLNATGTRLTYTQYSTTGESNIMTSLVRGSAIPAAGPNQVSNKQILYAGDALDSSFVPTFGAKDCLIYHRPSADVPAGGMQGMLACGTRSKYWPSIDNNTSGRCGHFAATADGNWVSCSNSSGIERYGTPYNAFGARHSRRAALGGPRWLNPYPEESSTLVSMRRNEYEPITPEWTVNECLEVVYQVYAEWGNTSTSFVYTAQCRDPDMPTTTKSAKLFLGQAESAPATAQSLIALSALITQFSGVDSIGLGPDYCSADFFLTPYAER